MNKKMNLWPGTINFKEAIKKIHDNGIAVVGGFILGNDTDTKDIFDKTIDFVHNSGIDGVQLSIQTPFPGTKIYQQLASEGRLLFTDLPEDWERYNGFEVVFRPKNMTAEELLEGHRLTYKATASLKSSCVRAMKTFLKTKSILGAAASFHWSYDCYKMVTRNGNLNRYAHFVGPRLHAFIFAESPKKFFQEAKDTNQDESLTYLWLIIIGNGILNFIAPSTGQS